MILLQKTNRTCRQKEIFFHTGDFHQEEWEPSATNVTFYNMTETVGRHHCLLLFRYSHNYLVAL